MTNLAQTYKAPAVAQFSLGVQHELKPSMIWVVQYVGNLAWHQNIERNINNFPINTSLDGPLRAWRQRSLSGDDCLNATSVRTCHGRTANSFRTYPGYGGITQEENTTNGNYNGFQTGLRVQNKWGLSGELDYTYSHEIDLTTYDLTQVSNPWNLKYDKGSGVARSPQYPQCQLHLQAAVLQQVTTVLFTRLLGGWEIAGTIIDETGIPVGDMPVRLASTTRSAWAADTPTARTCAAR